MYAEDLELLCLFFDELWTVWKPCIAQQSKHQHAYLFHRVALALRHVGRVRDAASPFAAAHRLYRELRLPERAATCANDLAETLVVLGDLDEAGEWASEGVEDARRHFETISQSEHDALRQARVTMSLTLAASGLVAHRRGDVQSAARLFATAESETEAIVEMETRRGKLVESGERYVFSRPGLQYWEHLLDRIEDHTTNGETNAADELAGMLTERLKAAVSWHARTGIAGVSTSYHEFARARLMSARLPSTGDEREQAIDAAEAHFARALALLHRNQYIWMVPEVLAARALLRDRARDPTNATLDRQEAAVLAERLGLFRPREIAATRRGSSGAPPGTNSTTSLERTMMDPIYYEILHTTTGQPTAQTIRDLIANDADLRVNSKPWDRTDMVPPASVLYILIVVVTDDLAGDAHLLGRLAAIFRRVFPVLPIVPNIPGYDFKSAPTDSISEVNAVGLNNPAGIVSALAHHGGLRPHTVDGHVFVSYARSDGADLASHIHDALEKAGFKAFLDVKSLPGAALVQPEIGGEVKRSELTILVDSEDASKSEWVEEELAIAQAAHIPVLAVSPTPDSPNRLTGQLPHVPWDAGASIESVTALVVNVARRMLARKIAFRNRVDRTLERICRLCGWELRKDPTPWHIEPMTSNLRVDWCNDEPPADVLRELRKSLGDNGQGVLVGGTKPYKRNRAQTLAEIGGGRVSATPLSRVASTIHNHITPLSLHGKRIFLSAAMPDKDESEVAKQTLVPFIVTFIQTIVGLGGTVVFGGHPSVTPLVYKAIVDHTTENIQAIELHQARMWIDELPKVAEDRTVFGQIHWHGDGSGPAADIAALRAEMIKPGLDGAVFVGGKLRESKTPTPGIVDEYQRFCAACPDSKAFVLGLALGAARSLIGRNEKSATHVDALVARELAVTSDPDMATALIVAELLRSPSV